MRYPRIYTVLQLRYHPYIQRIRELIKEKNQIELDVSVHRKPDYFKKWKGNREQSGGILFNLGIHYFDLIIWLFGKPKYYGWDYFNHITEETARGWLKADNYSCKWSFTCEEDKDKQRRIFKINGKEFNFSNKDNLAQENLHKYVYENLLRGKGITPFEQRNVIKLIENLYHLLLKYTYIIDISDLKKTWENMEKRAKYEIRKCEQEVFTADDIHRFDEFHKMSRPKRKITTQYLVNLYNELKPNCQLYFTNSAGAFISWDKKKAYYLLAGRNKRIKDHSPSMIIWQAMKDMNKLGIKEFDLCGANAPTKSFFKKSFGGRLVPQKRTYIPQF